ncbi:MAG: M3 family metallopeptidase [Proteobacteria bacterium]|nr:M3 family metallopeptidase [Pseudomonadota bacterium]
MNGYMNEGVTKENEGVREESNPLLAKGEVFFPYKDLRVDHCKEVLTGLKERVDAFYGDLERDKSVPSWDNTFAKMSALYHELSKILDPIWHLYGVNYQESYSEVMEKLREFSVYRMFRFLHSQRLYKKFIQLKDSELGASLNVAQKRILTNTLKAMEDEGVQLGEEDKKSLNQLVRNMSQRSMKFGDNTRNSLKEYGFEITDISELSGVPEVGLELFSEAYKQKTSKDSTAKEGPWFVGVDRNACDQILTYCDHRELRKKVYVDSMRRVCEGPFDNTENVEAILDLRWKKAQMLGFSHYADMSLNYKMADSVEAVKNLQSAVVTSCRDLYARELEEQQQFFRDIYGQDASYEDWDKAYVREKMKKSRHDFDESEVRQYFPLNQVLEGLFSVIKDVFEVEFEDITLQTDPRYLWDDHVSVYKVCDENKTGDDQVMGYLFFDPYARPGLKGGGAWMHGATNRYRSVDGTLHKPVAYVVCNFMPPSSTTPSLLNFRQVETLFHEFGHMLQQILTEVDDPKVSGTTGIERDAVEVPSQFMEYWYMKKDIFMSMAKHYQTGEVISEELYEKVVGAHHFGSGGQYMRQAYFGMLDMTFHCEDPKELDLVACSDRLLSETLGKPTNAYASKFFLSFSHIFSGGYAAGYYGYLWSRVMSADAFAYFDKAITEAAADGKDGSQKVKALGKSFRKTILALGGSEHPSDVYAKFSGSSSFPSIDAFLKYDVGIT